MMVMRPSCDCLEPVAAKFWQIYYATFSRHSYKCCGSVVRRSRDSLEKTCEHLATIWRENKTKRHSYECRANVMRHSHECRVTIVRMKMKISYIRGKVLRHSHECRATVARHIFKIRPEFTNLSHKCLFSETVFVAK